MALDTGISFTDNALVQALGAHLGMEGLFADKNATPPPVEMKPPAVGINETEKVRESKNVRQSYPRPSGGGRGLGLGGGPNAGMNLPGVMSPEVLMHPMVQQLLGQYGLTPESLQHTAENADPNLFLNKDFIARHPHLGGALEGGLEGLAFAKGGSTIGESMSNIAQGLLNQKAARADKYNNQLMMPFAQAQQVAGLKTTADEQAFKLAQAKHYQDLEDHYNAMDDTKAQLARIQALREQDVQDYHNSTNALKKQTQNLVLMKDIQATPFNQDEQAQYHDLVQKAGGNPLDVEPTEIQALINTAAQRKLNEQMQNKKDVAGIAGEFKVKAANVAAGGHAATLTYNDAKATWSQAQKDLNAFDKQSAANPFMMTDPDGNKLNSTQKRAAYRAKLMDKVKQAKDLMDQTANTNGAVKMPGTEFTPSPKKGKTYDLGTDTFH